MWRPLQNLLQSGVLGDRSDGELLREFTTRRKETAEPAFTALVVRHGPMVWRVCRSVLADPYEAEDAFQATFLVLVEHASSVRRKDSLASWLYGVAYRVACCARSAEARRKRHELRGVAERKPATVTSEPERIELRAIVVEELNQLSRSQRLAVVLCDLEELTHEQAAAQLGWPVGTVKSRLARGRERLKSRLIRRGVAPALGLIGTAALSEPGLAAPSAVLVTRAVQVAIGTNAGLSVTGSLSGVITILVREVSQAMWISKLKWAAAAALTSTALGVGGTVLWQRSEARQAPSVKVESHAQLKQADNEEAIWAKNRGNLKRIGLALHNFHQSNGHFPAGAISDRDGKPLLSWRVAILPFVEDPAGKRNVEALFNRFHLDEPWDSPHNRTLLTGMPRIFASPRDQSAETTTTVYRGIAGPGTMFEGEQGVKLDQVTDGPTRTLMVVEAADPVPWTKPDELTCVGQPPLPKPGSLRAGEYAALFASGHVRLIDPRNLLPAFITRQGGEAVYLERLRINELPFSPPPLIEKPRHGTAKAPALIRPEAEMYAKARTLTDALAILKSKLDKDGMKEFEPLLTEQSVRSAIRDFVRREENFLKTTRAPDVGSLRSSFEAIKPILQEIAERGNWPEGTSFFVFYTLGTAAGEVDGCWVRLEVVGKNRSKDPVMFAAPILDLSFGGGHWTLP